MELRESITIVWKSLTAKGKHGPATLAAMAVLLLVVPAGAAEKTPPAFDVLLPAVAFDRGAVQAVERRGWADGEGYILSEDPGSAWAEWDFSVRQAGIYNLDARFAAEQSRPVDIYVDGRLVRRAALDQTTGGWRSSTASWFPVDKVFLTEGKHTLSASRACCIPHIVAFGLARDPTMDPAKGPVALPESMWLQDACRIQDWMIWGLRGTESFQVRDGAYRIVNGSHMLNRPLYGTNGPDTVFAGDRPLIVLSRSPETKLGALRGRLVTGQGDKWLHDAQQIAFRYDGPTVAWEVGDPVIGARKVVLEVVPLVEAEGFMLRAAALSEEIQLRWWFGGMRADYPDRFAGAGALPLGDLEADTKGNQVTLDRVAPDKSTLDAPSVHVTNPAVPGSKVLVGVRPEAPWRRVETAWGMAAECDVPLGALPVYVIVSTSPTAFRDAAADPDTAWHAAKQHYQAIAERLKTETPSPLLDAALRANNIVLDGQYRPPSFLHGALRWGSECGGWYLGWRGWYGPIVAGDWERVAAAARMHMRHQCTSPERGGWSKGKIANFVTFDQQRSDTKTGYNMQEVFLDQLRSYYWWTGDETLMRELWPGIKQALEYERREVGRNLDGLYTNAINTFISDGHHYNGYACTQGSAYNVRLHRFAADVASLAGEDPAFYTQQAERTFGEMQRRLWMPTRGYYAEYVDGDGRWHDAAEAPSIYHPIEMGVADAFQSYQMTRYVDQRLWRFGDQILVNDWFPVIVTNGCLNFNETLNTALAYYHAGRWERAWRLLEVCSASTAIANVPGNMSCYASREGGQGTYVDFTDASSMFARTVVEGLFGLEPRVDCQHVVWRPRFPSVWDHASLTTRGFRLRFRKTAGDAAEYVLESDMPLEHVLLLPAAFAKLGRLELNGVPAKPEWVEDVGRPYVRVTMPAATRSLVRLAAAGPLPKPVYPPRPCFGKRLDVTCPRAKLLELRDPQGILDGAGLHGDRAGGVVRPTSGHHTVFLKVAAEDEPGRTWWEAIDVECVPPFEALGAQIATVAGMPSVGVKVTVRNNTGEPMQGPAVIRINGSSVEVACRIDAGAEHDLRCALPANVRILPGHTPIVVELVGHRVAATARLWRALEADPERRQAFARECRMLAFDRNDRLAEIFTRKYEVENSPQLNVWTWYNPDVIDTKALRRRAVDGVLASHVGVPFRIATGGADGLFLSRWNPFPRSATISVGGHVDKLYLLLANHTHNSQTHMTQAEVTLVYADGSETIVPLDGPHDLDGMLQHYSDMAPEWIGGEDQGWYGHGRAKGVHADVTDIPVDPSRELTAFRLRCVTEETLLGLLGATAHATAQAPDAP